MKALGFADVFEVAVGADCALPRRRLIHPGSAGKASFYGHILLPGLVHDG